MKIPNQLKNKIKIDLLFYIAIVAVAGLATYIGSYVIKQVKVSESSTPTPTPPPASIVEKPSQYPDYDAIKGNNPDRDIEAVKFTDSCSNDGCVNDNPATKEFDGIKKTYAVKGIISRGYLYVEAAVDYKRPLSNYDNFYFTLNYQGGHLLTTENLLPVPPSDISRYLYDLRFISYTYKSVVFSNINFLALLQNNTVFNIHTAVSSDRPGRVLKEVSIYYQCAEDSVCDIEEIKDQ